MAFSLPNHPLLIPTLVLSLGLLISCCAASALHQSQESNGGGAALSSGDSELAASRLTASTLAQLLRGRRSAELQAPPHYYGSRLAAGFLGAAPTKRDDGYWIWMPAHGYMSVPRDEMVASTGEKDGMGNLLRYGRK